MRAYFVDARGRGVREFEVCVDPKTDRPPHQINMPVLGEFPVRYDPTMSQETMPPPVAHRRFYLERYTRFSAIYRENA